MRSCSAEKEDASNLPVFPLHYCADASAWKHGGQIYDFSWARRRTQSPSAVRSQCCRHSLPIGSPERRAPPVQGRTCSSGALRRRKPSRLSDSPRRQQTRIQTRTPWYLQNNYGCKYTLPLQGKGLIYGYACTWINSAQVFFQHGKKHAYPLPSLV